MNLPRPCRPSRPPSRPERAVVASSERDFFYVPIKCATGFDGKQRLKPKRPRTLRSGAFCLFGWDRSEPEVHAASDRVRTEFLVVVHDAVEPPAAIEAAEVVVEIFDLGGPIAGDRKLDAGAGGPADLRVGRAAEARMRRRHVAEGGAAGDVGHPAIERIAQAAARGAEPGVLAAAAADASPVGGPLDVGPVDVALQADHPGAELPVVADRAADHAARRVEAAGAVPARAAPGAAAVDTDVKAGPVVVGRRIDWRPDRHLLPRQV